MDWTTVAILAPFVASAALALATLAFPAPLDSLVLALALASAILWTAVLTDTTDCVWEGFADGPLPVQCRPTEETAP